MSRLEFAKMRVLVVEDQRPFLVLLRSMANTMGAQSVVMAQNGEAAVAACRKEKFDVIISDVHLGNDKKNGYQFLEEIRLRMYVKPETIFVMISGDNQRPVVLGSLERQPDDYLIKPFSQAQLSNRIHKAFLKKTQLKDVYRAYMKQDIDTAIATCEALIAQGCQYRQACHHLLTELYWKSQKFEQAQHMLQGIMQHKPVPWATVAAARTEMFLQNYQEAITLAKPITKNRVLAVEGHDIMAQCYLRIGQLDDAINEIKRSINLSPFSLDRQYLGADIAREYHDFHFAKQCCKAIFEQTRRSVYRDVRHLCNFVRSILDAAENAAEKGERNKFQQEALITLQRLRSDDILGRLKQPFDYSAFEDIINARVNFLDGKISDARKTLFNVRDNLEQQHPELPIALVPDSLKVYFDLGEFDEVETLTERLRADADQLDPNVEYLLRKTGEDMVQQVSQFRQICEKAQEKYGQGKYQAAYEAYTQALKLSPHHVDVIMSLLQSLLQILDRRDKSDPIYITEAKKNHKLIADLKLTEQQQARYAELRTAFKRHMELS